MADNQMSCFCFSLPGYNLEKWISKPHRHIGLLKKTHLFTVSGRLLLIWLVMLHRILCCPWLSLPGSYVWCCWVVWRVGDHSWTLWLESLTHWWIMSLCSCHDWLFITFMPQSVSYHFTHRPLAACYNLLGFLCFTLASGGTELIHWGISCTEGCSTCHWYWCIALCDLSQ